jgi:hypothetical protein
MILGVVVMALDLVCMSCRHVPSTQVTVLNGSSYAIVVGNKRLDTGRDLVVRVANGDTARLWLSRENDTLVIASLVSASDPNNYDAEARLFGVNYSHVHVEESSPYVDAWIEYVYPGSSCGRREH